MKRVKRSDEIVDFDKEVIKQEERIFGEDDIKKMFDYFERNNYRENPICEYVLGWKLGINQNNKIKNNRVIYEALANKLRSSLLGDDVIYLILIII